MSSAAPSAAPGRGTGRRVRVAHLGHHERLLLEEREWLRGLLEQEREAHVPVPVEAPAAPPRLRDRVVSRYPALPTSPPWRIAVRARGAARRLVRR